MIKRTRNINAVLNFLKKNTIINLNIIGIIENEQDAEVYVDDMNNPSGVFIRLDYFHYMYTENDYFIEEVIRNFFNEPGWYGFSGLYKPIADKIRSRFENNWESCCDIYYFPNERPKMQLIKNPVSEIKIEDAKIVDKFYTYKNESTLEQIKKDLQSRPSSAIYYNNEIASWVLVHNDNSMGIMYTREEYRNRRYAVDVTIDLTSKIINMGKIPFLQINKHNNMSPGLAAKCGFVKNGECEWFGFIVGAPKELTEGEKESREKFIEVLRQNNIDEILKDALLEYLNPKGMHLFLINMKDDQEKIKDLSIERICTDEQKKLWGKIAAKSYTISDDRKEEFEDLVYKMVSSEKHQFNLYMGFYNGKPVFTAAVGNIDNWNGYLCFLASILLENKQYFCSAWIRKVLLLERSEGRELIFAHISHISEELTGTMKEVGFKE